MKPKILIYERGAWLPFAQALSKDATVLLFTEFREIANVSRNALVGRDVPGIQRVDSFWKHIDDVDVLAFPDIGDGDMQTWLRKRGYHVWGCGDADMIENDRGEFKRLLAENGMAVGPYVHLVGLDALEAELEQHDDRYVKTSFWRGDLETYHHITWEMTRPWFDDLTSRLGPQGESMEFLVEEPIKAVELGYDGFCIDGKFPQHAAYGLEIKDSAYLGRSCLYEDLPVCLQEANEGIAEALKVLGMRGNYSSEVRICDDGTFYLTDPTTRCPSPPIGAMSKWITNWAQIVVQGAHGFCYEPKYAAEYACEIEMQTQALTHHFVALDIPEGVVDSVRLRRACVVDDRYWCIPHPWLEIAGSAVGLGSTAEEAIDAAVAKQAAEKGGRGGLDPARYGDWEIKGLTSDF